MIYPTFSLHCTERIVERGIQPQSVVAAINFGRVVDRIAGRKTYALGRLRVVLSPRGNEVVTVWRTRRQNPKRDIRKARREREKDRRRWG